MAIGEEPPKAASRIMAAGLEFTAILRDAPYRALLQDENC